MDPVTGLTDESFTLKYCDVANLEDFLILRQTYELAVQREWRAGDRFRSAIDDYWWCGQLLARVPYKDRRESQVACCRIR